MNKSGETLPAEVVPTLADLEATIERNLEAFWLVGEALLAINEHKLYKATHGSFADYCAERWGFSERTTFRRLQQAKASKALGSGVSQRTAARGSKALTDANTSRARDKRTERDDNHDPQPEQLTLTLSDHRSELMAKPPVAAAKEWTLTEASGLVAWGQEVVAILTPAAKARAKEPQRSTVNAKERDVTPRFKKP